MALDSWLLALGAGVFSVLHHTLHEDHDNVDDNDVIVVAEGIVMRLRLW